MNSKQTDSTQTMWNVLAGNKSPIATLPLFALLLAVACGGGEQELPALSDSLLADTTQTAQTVDAAVTDIEPVEIAEEPDSADLVAVLNALRSQVARIEGQIQQLQPAAPAALVDQPGEQVGEQAVQQEGLDAGRRVQETAQDVRHFTLRAIWAAILLIAALFFIQGAVWLLGVLSERSAKRRLLFKRLIPIVRLVVWSLVIFYVVSSVFEVDRAGLLAGTAALGVGIGFAAQGVLKNVIGGLIIVFDQSFQVGDKIKVGGTYGEVVSIGMRATRIVTPDDNLVSVPNSQVVEDQVANANAGALDCQVVVDLYLPGWVDVAKAKAIAKDAAVNSQYVYLEKPVVVNVKRILSCNC